MLPACRSSCKLILGTEVLCFDKFNDPVKSQIQMDRKKRHHSYKIGKAHKFVRNEV